MKAATLPPPPLPVILPASATPVTAQIIDLSTDDIEQEEDGRQQDRQQEETDAQVSSRRARACNDIDLIFAGAERALGMESGEGSSDNDGDGDDGAGEASDKVGTERKDTMLEDHSFDRSDDDGIYSHKKRKQQHHPHPGNTTGPHMDIKDSFGLDSSLSNVESFATTVQASSASGVGDDKLLALRARALKSLLPKKKDSHHENVSTNILTSTSTTSCTSSASPAAKFVQCSEMEREADTIMETDRDMSGDGGRGGDDDDLSGSDMDLSQDDFERRGDIASNSDHDNDIDFTNEEGEGEEEEDEEDDEGKKKERDGKKRLATLRLQALRSAALRRRNSRLLLQREEGGGEQGGDERASTCVSEEHNGVEHSTEEEEEDENEEEEDEEDSTDAGATARWIGGAPLALGSTEDASTLHSSSSSSSSVTVAASRDSAASELQQLQELQAREQQLVRKIEVQTVRNAIRQTEALLSAQSAALGKARREHESLCGIERDQARLLAGLRKTQAQLLQRSAKVYFTVCC